MRLAPGPTATLGPSARPDPVLRRRHDDADGLDLRGALETVMVGVLARLETGAASDPAAITEAFRQSLALGEAYASRGYAASSLIQAYLGLRERLTRTLPPNLPADEPWAQEWQVRLERAVDNFLKVALRAFERQRVAAWERLARVDDATRVYQRGYFERRFLDELRRAERYQRPITVMVVDVSPSDTGGGAAAANARARLARLSSRALESVLRDVDLVTRAGGPELVALLPDTPLCGGRTAAERALQVARDEATAFDLDPDALGLAIGLAAYPDHGSDPWTVLAAADHALYRARRNGLTLALA